MKSIFFIFILLCCFSKLFSQGFNNTLELRMSKDENLKKLKLLDEIATKKLETNYYGNDLQLIKNLDSKCFSNQEDLVECLKSRGFKKAYEYSKSLFDRFKLVNSFRNEYPEFSKLEKNEQLRLFKKYVAFNNVFMSKF